MAADICELDGRFLVVVVDYFSNFIEVSRLCTISSNAVIHALSEIWARWGTLETLVTDNDQQFDCSELKAFSKEWCFLHITSSPHYPQSNGKAENAIRTIKWLFTCARVNFGHYWIGRTHQVKGSALALLNT